MEPSRQHPVHAHAHGAAGVYNRSKRVFSRNAPGAEDLRRDDGPRGDGGVDLADGAPAAPTDASTRAESLRLKAELLAAGPAAAFSSAAPPGAHGGRRGSGAESRE